MSRAETSELAWDGNQLPVSGTIDLAGGRNRLRVVSLFSGAGGLDLGFIRAGHTIVWANDIDKDAVETYRKNIGDHIVLGDLKDIPSKDIPECDIVIGGFPCQGFSQANLRRSKDDERNLLYREFLRVVGEKTPSYFVAENVRGILSMDDGNAIKEIVRSFKDKGYSVDYRLFNLADYGVPQQRRRVFIVGTRNDIPKSQRFKFPEPTHAKDPSKSQGRLLPWVSISEALEGIQEPDGEMEAFPNHVCSKYKVKTRDFTGHRRTDPLKPCPTILARGNGKGGVVALPHPSNKRRMSVRESAIAQTFPNNFEFIGKIGSMYRQVGNAVPVLFAEILAKQVAVPEKR